MGILWSAPYGDPSGFGTAGREYAKALYNAGVNLRINHHNYYIGREKKMLSIDDADFFNRKDLVVDDSVDLDRYVFVNHVTPYESLNPRILKYFRRCKDSWIYSVWETDKVPYNFLNNLESYGKIITASEFSKNAFKATFPELQIEVVPHVIHNNLNNQKINEKIYQYKTNGYIVFFASLEWHIGKGYDILLEGFLKAFENKDNVILLLKTYNLSSSNYKSNVINYIKNLKNKLGIHKPKIIPIIGSINYDELMSLYSSSDCYISMSRREAFGLTMSEAFSFGLPIICPDKGGHREFLNDDNSLQIKSNWKNIDDVEAERFLYRGQKWIEPNLNDYIDNLLYFYDKKPNFKFEIEKTIDAFSPNEIAKKLCNILL